MQTIIFTYNYIIYKIWICFLLCIFFTLPSFSQVDGFVKDQLTGEVIPNALVTYQATTVRTTTGLDGSFSLPDATGVDIVIVGAKKGYYNNSIIVSTPANGVEVLLDSVPQDNNAAYDLLNPETCGICHPTQVEQWTDSPMSNAGVNTWVYDIYSGDGTAGGMGGFVYLRDSEHAANNPESECSSCHQPETWIANPFTAIDPINRLSLGAMHGVSCEVCHKVAHIDESKPNYPGIYPSVVTWTRPNSADHQVEYGLLGDTDFDLAPTLMNSSYQPQLRAEVCAACHQDKNDPDEDGDFEEPNGVISEPTYLEWLASPYSDSLSVHFATCIDCHMPSFGLTEVCEFPGYDPPDRDPETIRSHRIEGTTPFFLENAVTMTVNGEKTANTLEIEVLINNDKTGHHVPDGVTIRNMILLVEAWRIGDNLELVHTGSQVVHELGGVGDPAQGYYADLPGKFFSKLNHNSNGDGPTFFTDATGIQWDNRIAALQTDTSNYTFEIPNDTDEYEVRARLIYRRSFRFLVDAKGWVEDGHGNPLEDVMPPYYGHLMEEESWSTLTIGYGDDIALTNFQLHQNTPNPFNPSTLLKYELPITSNVTLKIFDLTGKEIKTLVDEAQSPGVQSVVWDGTDKQNNVVSSGVYIYQLQVGQSVQFKKMLFLK